MKNNLLTNISNSLSKMTGRTSLVFRKNSPEILLGAGLAGVIVTIVTACKATLEADKVLDHHADKMERIHQAEKYQDEENPYPKEVAIREKTAVYVQTGFEFTKLYAPTIAIGSLSIASILVSNRILKGRYLGAVAAYNAISTSYNQYRGRVRERYGDEVDYELRYGVRKETVETKQIDENGKTVKKKETIEYIEGAPSDYARYWEKYLRDGVLNPNWEDNPEFNLYFLKGVENQANYVLHSRGYIFLNEVYDMLGFEHTQFGQLVGWYDDGSGDGYVDLGLYDATREGNRRFINGDANAILLDFNVDGMIWDKI